MVFRVAENYGTCSLRAVISNLDVGPNTISAKIWGNNGNIGVTEAQITINVLEE